MGRKRRQKKRMGKKKKVIKNFIICRKKANEDKQRKKGTFILSYQHQVVNHTFKSKVLTKETVFPTFK